MYEEIAKQIKDATSAGNKSAMVHFQVLKNAHLLADVEPVEFCRKVGMRDSYAVEFYKMLKVARIMQQQGIGFTDAND